ncbi:hypothetical protein D3C81_1586420 [compost metagenome]
MPQPERQQCDKTQRCQPARQQRRQLAIHAKFLQQPALLRAVILEHPALPRIGQSVEAQAQVPQPCRPAQCTQRLGFVAAQGGVHAFFHTARRHGAGRVHAHPSAPGDPHLGPGVSIRLPDDVVPAQRVVLAALIAHHGARGHAGGAHQEHEAAGVVLAEATAGVEQEAVHLLLAQRRRGERVGEGRTGEEPQCGLHAPPRVGILRHPAASEFAAARIAFRQRERQRQRAPRQWLWRARQR